MVLFTAGMFVGLVIGVCVGVIAMAVLLGGGR